MESNDSSIIMDDSIGLNDTIGSPLHTSTQSATESETEIVFSEIVHIRKISQHEQMLRFGAQLVKEMKAAKDSAKDFATVLTSENVSKIASSFTECSDDTLLSNKTTDASFTECSNVTLVGSVERSENVDPLAGLSVYTLRTFYTLQRTDVIFIFRRNERIYI